MRFGLFGAGRIGRVHADSIAYHPRAELAVVYDPIEAAAADLAARFGGRASTEVDSILADDSIDAVIIASPTPTHVDLLTRSVQAGKAVLCEKPIDLDLARVDACWNEIAGTDATVMLGFNRRFDPTFREVHDRIVAGEIGTLEQLTIISRDPSPAPQSYIAVSGGMFRDMTIHDFDLARFFLGEVTEVYAAGANLIEPYIQAEGDIDSAVVVLRGESGALAHITNARRSVYGYDQRIEAFGSEGLLSAANQTATTVRHTGRTATDSGNAYLNFFLDRYTAAYRAELDHLITSVENRTAPSPDFRDGREALVLAEAALESLRTGATVKLGG